MFQQRELPSDMPELRLVQPVSLVDLLTNSGHAASKSEVRRLVQGGGIKLDGERVDDAGLVIAPTASTFSRWAAASSSSWSRKV